MKARLRKKKKKSKPRGGKTAENGGRYNIIAKIKPSKLRSVFDWEIAKFPCLAQMTPLEARNNEVLWKALAKFRKSYCSVKSQKKTQNDCEERATNS